MGRIQGFTVRILTRFLLKILRRRRRLFLYQRHHGSFCLRDGNRRRILVNLSVLTQLRDLAALNHFKHPIALMHGVF